jgi:hypothetical protein
MSTSWLSQIGDLLQHYSGQQAPPAQVEQHYDKIAQAAPQPSLAAALSSAFRSAQTPNFPDLIASLFTHSNTEQKSGLLRTLGFGDPAAPQNVSPEQVKTAAQEAEKRDPSIVDRAGQFYSQHPFLVKTLGAAAMSAVLSHIAREHR